MKDIDNIYLKYPNLLDRIYIYLRSRIIHLNDIEKQLPKSGTIYDIGCGYGLGAYYYSKQSNIRKVIGLDIDEKRINLNKKIFADMPNLIFKRQDFRLDTSIGKADAIVIYDLLHHVPIETQKSLIKSARKKLRRGGVLLIKEIDKSKSIKTFFTWILDKLMTKLGPVYYQKSEVFIDFVEKEQFDVEVQEIKSILPFPHYLLVCRPK